MCLTVKMPAEFKTAEEDLTFYKVLFCYNGVYQTPYMAFAVELDKEYSAEEEPLLVQWKSSIEINDESKKLLGADEATLSSGVYHLFVDRADAEKWTKFRNIMGGGNVVVKAIVPKGSLYIEGVTNYGAAAIGAKKVIYQELSTLKENVGMTQKEKQLLLKDLCARLLYHPYINVCNDSWEGCQPGEFDTKLYSQHIDAFVCDRIKIRPYLRTMSSMTDGERFEYDELQHFYTHGLDFNVDEVDWLNAHHFDYRELIPRGLALEAPEGMYKQK